MVVYEFEDLGSRMNRFLAEGKTRRPYFVVEMAPEAWQPHADVYETREAVIVLVDLAGVKAESVDIEVHGKSLRIAGTRAARFRSGARRLHQLEVAQGAFERTLSLPAAVDQNRAEASYVDGFLEVVLPFAQPARPSVVAGTSQDQGESASK